MNALTTEEALVAARQLVDTPSQDTTGLWARAAAVLVRQALETALRDLWHRKARGTHKATFTAQLLCLPAFLDDEDLAGAVAWTWAATSAACHHNGYALPPVRGELETWAATVERFIAGTRG